MTRTDWGILLGLVGLGTTVYLATRKRDDGAPDDSVTLLDQPYIVPQGSTDTATIRQAQVWLHALGYYDGPIDGMENAQFLGQLDQFQFDHFVPQSGQVDTATMQALANAVVQPGATHVVAPLAGVGGVRRTRKRYAERF